MKASDEIHELIRSMTMNEKRHFRLMSERSGDRGSMSYLDLFDRIAKQESYDEKTLKSGLDQAGKFRFASEKNYLSGLVTDSLIHFHRNRPSIAVYQKLISIDVLYGKKMFRSCLKVARRGKQETLRLEKLFPALSFIRWEAALLSVTGNNEDLDPVIELERETIERLAAQAALMQYSFRIRNMIGAGKVDAVKLKRMVAEMHKTMERAEKKGTTTFLSHYYFHSAVAMQAAFLQKHESRKESYLFIHRWLDDNPQFIEDIPHIYHNNMNNIVNACIFLKQYDEALSWIEKQRSFMKKYSLDNEAMSARIFLNTYENEIVIYQRKDLVAKGVTLIKPIESGLRKFGEYYQGEQYDLILALGLLLFSADDFKGASRWLNRIAAMRTKIQLRPEVLVTARLVLLIIQYENRERSLSPQMKSAEQWLRKSAYFKSADLFLGFLKTLSEPDTGIKTRTQLSRHLSDFEKQQKNPNETALSKFFDFGDWMKKKMAALG